MSVLNHAVGPMNRAVDITPQDLVDRAKHLNSLGRLLGQRSERTGSLDDLNHAIELMNISVDVTPQDHPDRAGHLNDLGTRLCIRSDRTSSLDDLNRAIEVTNMAVDTTPQDHHSRATRLINLSSSLGMRSARTGSLDDLNRAIELANMAVDITPQDHHKRTIYLSNLGNSLRIRSTRTGSLDDLNRAIEVTNLAVDTAPQDCSNRSMYLNNLGRLLGRRSTRTGLLDDLSRAIEATSTAVDTSPQDHPDRLGYLRNLGHLLDTRFERIGSLDDLHRAVDVLNIAIDNTPQDHPGRAACLNSLGIVLRRQSKRTGSVNDLNRAIELANMALDTTPQDHHNRAIYLNTLGILLGDRFARFSSLDDLNYAVKVLGTAVHTTPQDHPDRAGYLNNLGSSLNARFERAGSLDDLNRAIEIMNLAIDTTPQDHPSRAGYLHNLSSSLGNRFGRIGLIKDFNHAIEMIDLAVNTTPYDHPDRAIRLNNFGNLLAARAERTGSLDNLNYAIEVLGKAVDTIPQDHPDRAGHLNDFGIRLCTRFERTGSLDDLKYSIDVLETAVATTAQDHPNRARYLNNLGDSLSHRFKQDGLPEDLHRMLSSYKQGWCCPTAIPSVRIRSAQRAAKVLISQSNWNESSQLLKEAVKLLPLVSPRSLQNIDKQYVLADFAGLASLAAATALNTDEGPSDVLQLLELGRNVIAGLLVEIRGDISDLQDNHPGLAKRFISLRDELDTPASSPTDRTSAIDMNFWESQVERRLERTREFDSLVEKIRAQPEFCRFLLPPTVEEFKAAANSGPIIVVSLSSIRCDAIIIEHDQIRLLRLPGLNFGEVQTRIQNLRSSRRKGSTDLIPLLEWLWVVVCLPCLDALGFQTPVSNHKWPHVWWVPTGLLSQLPLHAAGRYTQNSGETVMDRVISSYASSIKAMIYERRRCITESSQRLSGDAVLVGMHKTPGLSSNSILPCAVEEVETLEKLCPSLHLRPVKPTLRKTDVLRHLKTCRVFHFAGHARSDPLNPSLSCLLLEDWEQDPLTVGDLREHSLQKSSPFLGYLSACSTGANEADQLTDETVHLINALQLAGFRHVIGTLWEVADEHCVDVAKIVYETVRDEGATDMAICKGLHRAIRALRDDRIEQDRGRRDAKWKGSTNQVMQPTNFRWVPYVHFGV